MNRRSNEVEGCVNFPTGKLPNENEGGMYVQSVVISAEQDLPVCCGGSCYIFKSEVLCGDDSKDGFDVEKYTEIGEEKFPEVFRFDVRHFPNYDRTEFVSPESKIAWERCHKYLSNEYLAVILMGSTGWSCGDWVCTYSDLTEEGREVREMIRNLYPESEIYLITWLDT